MLIALSSPTALAGQSQPRDPAPAAALPALDIGSPAPALSIRKWINGDQTAAGGFEPGKVYIVEFWATWCVPCRKAIPHLSELQRRHGDQGLVVIGVASQEHKGVEDLERFVRREADRLTYTVAWDDDGKTDRAWMEAAGLKSIPTAFIVDQRGRIAWIGHPMTGLDKAVEKIVAETYDLDGAARAARHQRDVEARTRPLARSFEQSVRAGEHGKALVIVDEILDLDPRLNSSWALDKFRVLADGFKDYDRAYAFARASVDGPLHESPEALLNLAWLILDEPGLEHRDAPLALKAARRAHELLGDDSAAVHMTIARGLFLTGERDAALTHQERAVALAPPGAEREQQRRRLEDYRRRLTE